MATTLEKIDKKIEKHYVDAFMNPYSGKKFTKNVYKVAALEEQREKLVG